MNKPVKKPVGTVAFRKAFVKATENHRDDWGVSCAYDFEAWQIWKAAIRYYQRQLQAQEYVGDRLPTIKGWKP